MRSSNYGVPLLVNHPSIGKAAGIANTAFVSSLSVDKDDWGG